jgi:hypothetical protein
VAPCGVREFFKVNIGIGLRVAQVARTRETFMPASDDCSLEGGRAPQDAAKAIKRACGLE